jgi:branched-chain amino acid transport system ATP-binding protein
VSALAITGLTVRHGGVVALDGVDLTAASGQVTGLIGPNGAGKTTLLDAVTGFTAVAAGAVRLDGDDVTGRPPHRLAAAGLVRTFQSLELFDDLSVRENVLVAARSAPATRSRWSGWRDAVWPRAQHHDAVDDALDALGLDDLAGRTPATLSNGERHRVALARALVTRPGLLLLDEPAAGLGPSETDELAAIVRRLPERGTSVLMIDHDMGLVLGICDIVHVLDLGRRIASGTPAEIRRDPAVIAAYLGTSA